MTVYYRGILDQQEVLVCIDQDDMARDPLDDTSPEGDHRPLFVLTNHTRYILGDKDAENTAWRLLRASPKWNASWDVSYLEKTECNCPPNITLDCCVKKNPDYIDLNGGLDEIIEAAQRVGAHVMPVFMYDHSGISLSLRNDIYPFNDRWDAGFLGILLWTTEQQAAHGGEGDATSIMRSYFEEYQAYVQEELYDMTVVDPTIELTYLRAKHDNPELLWSDLSKEDLKFCCAKGEAIDSVGSLRLDIFGQTVESAARYHFKITDMIKIGEG